MTLNNFLEAVAEKLVGLWPDRHVFVNEIPKDSDGNFFVGIIEATQGKKLDRRRRRHVQIEVLYFLASKDNLDFNEWSVQYRKICLDFCKGLEYDKETVVIWSVLMQETGQKNSIPLSDEALALRFQNGDDAAFSELAARYLKVIRIKACSFREIFSLEREDLYQEGLLGLLDAANSYKPSERTSFETYAGRCINNRIVSAVRRSSSLKNSFLNNAVPIEEMENLGADRLSDPQTLLESRDEMDRLLSVIHISLSDFELRVLSLYLGGYKRQEAERKLGISARAFDNAMARVRKKLRQKNNDAKG